MLWNDYESCRLQDGKLGPPDLKTLDQERSRGQDVVMERMETIWPLDPSRVPFAGQEIVVLTSLKRGNQFTATVVRTWVSDLESTGLENDITDPVEVFAEVISGDLASLHARAIAEVLCRLGSDYEIVDLFCNDQSVIESIC